MRWMYIVWALLLLLLVGGYVGWRLYDRQQAEQQFVATISPALYEVAGAYNRYLDVKKKPPTKAEDLLPFLAKKKLSAEEAKKVRFPDDRVLDVRLLTDPDPVIKVNYGAVRHPNLAADAQTIVAWCVASPRCAVAVMIDGTIKVMTEEELRAAI